ncbi:NUDIX domain-containing protein [Pontibacter arcticus]|uniref:NUDIX hydrolase n=1 Tax=Pontibacter arcticus TaxID=2080288 RepID=A0A364RFP2_9BACT|nr:NUDIX domain-containing protein [Pontibacter arcticus]RAU83075.1 NUDIX hydrolase [Pontibacter arcticus]
MNELTPPVAPYAHQLRVRVSGICVIDKKLVLAKHGKTINNKAFWAPPGGGLEFGEKVHDCLKREFLEETGIEVEVVRFLFVNEFLENPLHAIELFFEVRATGGKIITGTDPEAAEDEQLIENVQLLTLPQLREIPTSDKHRILQHLFSFDDLFGMSHYFSN